jgi:hypothetical protein
VTSPTLKIAVVGHTNTGKTSLLRTLTRDASFGEVCDRPATTQHVEGTVLLVNGAPLVELYDTPGLEDPIGLFEHLEALRGERRVPWINVILQFLEQLEARARFEQEAKALRQVLASDVALYVVDVRDRVLGKHHDELEILGHCAKPVVPVLNFIASPEARATEWRDRLAKVGMHAVAEFDTVILNEFGEQRLYEKMQTLLDDFRPTLDALIHDRQRQRAELIHASAELLADLLIDVAAFRVVVPAEQRRAERVMESFKQAVRDREQQCVRALLELFRFRLDDYETDVVPIDEGQWGLDLFNPASLRRFGVRAGGGAAAGGMAGLAVDAMTGGLSLGAGAALGATLGALWGSFESHGRRMVDYVRGYTELRVQDATLRLIAVRQIELIQALLRRGHASQDKIRVRGETEATRRAWASTALPEVLQKAKTHPEWSRLSAVSPAVVEADTSRAAALEHLAHLITPVPARSADISTP